MIYQLVQKTQWGCGAAGSAREWHSRGRGFNPRQLHQNMIERATMGDSKGVRPLRGERARGSATRGITSVTVADAGEMVSRPERAPSARVGERCFRFEPTRERGSIPASSTDTMLDNLTLINSGLRREWAFPLVMRLPPPSL